MQSPDAMSAIIRPMISKVRVFRHGYGWHDPYDLETTFHAWGADGDIALLEGLVNDRFTRSHWTAINDALARAGYARAQWFRGSGRAVDVPLRAPAS